MFVDMNKTNVTQWSGSLGAEVKNVCSCELLPTGMTKYMANSASLLFVVWMIYLIYLVFYLPMGKSFPEIGGKSDEHAISNNV